MKKELQAIYFKNDLATQSLTITAISQLIIKILYFNNNSMSIDEIRKSIKTNIGSNISKEKLEEALGELEKKSIINIHETKYVLRKSHFTRLKKSHNARNERFDSVVNRYFSQSNVAKEKIIEWFNEININFFAEYSSEWINNIVGKSKKNHDYVKKFKAIHNPKIYRKFDIPSSERKWFANQFIEFLRSYNSDDNSIMWDYANSMFSSKLISSNIFADKSIKDIFKDSIVVLDTNVLLYLDIEEDEYSQSYKILGRIFEELNITPVFFNITKHEYSEALEHIINQINIVTQKYNYDVYSKSDDIFMRTAIRRGCKTQEDFNTFFDDLRIIPEFFGSRQKIEECDNKEIAKIIIKGMKDKKLIDEMNEIFKKYHDFDKKQQSLEHDAGLINGVIYLRNDQKSLIITRDHTVHRYSVENTKKGDLPLAINIETIINLFAVNDGGIEVDPCDFVPLFASTVRNSLIPEIGSFRIEDLTRMYEYESEIVSLEEEDIVSIAKDINHARLKGENEKKIALIFQRRFQAIKIDIKDELTNAKSKLHEQDDTIGKLTDENINFKTNYVKKRRTELKKQYHKEQKRALTFSWIILFVILAISAYGILFLIDADTLTPIQSFIISIASSIILTLICSKVLLRPIISKDFVNKIDCIDSLIEDELKKLLKDDYIHFDFNNIQ